MKNRLVCFLAPLALGAFLCLYTQPAMAQQPASGPDQGQQGEFAGENVDTGAAALETGPEAGEVGQVGELGEVGEVGEVGELGTKESASLVSHALVATGAPASTGADLNVDGNFDLQEIGGLDTPEPN